jgi:small membrane protein
VLQQLIQAVLVGLIALIVLHVLTRWRQGELRRLPFVGWLLFWGAAALVVLRPEISTKAAHRFGVGRGADLVLYFSLVFVFYVLFRILTQLERMSREITEIVRALALVEARRTDQPRAADTPGGDATPPRRSDEPEDAASS